MEAILTFVLVWVVIIATVFLIAFVLSAYHFFKAGTEWFKAQNAKKPSLEAQKYVNDWFQDVDDDEDDDEDDI